MYNVFVFASLGYYLSGLHVRLCQNGLMCHGPLSHSSTLLSVSFFFFFLAQLLINLFSFTSEFKSFKVITSSVCFHGSSWKCAHFSRTIFFSCCMFFAVRLSCWRISDYPSFSLTGELLLQTNVDLCRHWVTRQLLV